MRATLRGLASGAAVALGVVAFGTGLAAEEGKRPSPEEVTRIVSEAGTPGPEHEKLAQLAGSWTYTCKMWMDPSQPAIETKGTVERKSILGGRFLEETYTGTGLDGKPGFEGRNLLGYDNAQKKYTSTFICSMGTGVCTGLGAADGSGTLTYQTQAYCPIKQGMMHGKDVVRISGDKVVIESYWIEDGEEVKAMELVSVRK
jgi:hypothetical protein